MLLTLALLPQVPGVASHGPLTPNLLQVDLHPDYLDHAETIVIMLIMQICGAFQNAFQFSGSFCCLECCSCYCLICQPLLKRGRCQIGLGNTCEKSNKIIFAFLAFLFGFIRVSGQVQLKKSNTHLVPRIFIPQLHPHLTNTVSAELS